MKKLMFVLLSFSLPFLFTSCGDEEDMTLSGDLNLNITGLEDLGPEFVYEGWMIVDGQPVTTGVFTVDGNGDLSRTAFELDKSQLDLATAFVLTIEPANDPDPAPSAVHILAGDFSGSSADLSIAHPAAIGNDFSTAAGGYILATPTNGANTNENSGIWFLDPADGPGPALVLPDLPEGWAYEGWAVIDGQPVSTGTFRSAAGADDFDGFSGTGAAPPFPGEDFLSNAPDGLSFPTDIRGGLAVISIEPVPDNSTAPFVLKPLVGEIAADALDHSLYTVDKNLNFPGGMVMR